MQTPILVFPPDQIRKNNRHYLYIDAARVVAAHPIYAEHGSRLGHHHGNKLEPPTTLIGYSLSYIDGKHYVCDQENELRKVGLSLRLKRHQPPIGFLH